MKLSVVVIVKLNESILMYNRGDSLREEWTVLGGHMHEDESIFECAEREVLEEASIRIDNLRFLTILEDKVNGYISFYVLADYREGILLGNIGEKIQDLQWIDIYNLPINLYGPFQRFSSGENIHGKYISDFLNCKK